MLEAYAFSEGILKLIYFRIPSVENWFSMLSWVLRGSRHISLNKTTHLSTIFELFSKGRLPKEKKVKIGLLSKVRWRSLN